jgi:hypothetical protein
VVTLYEQEHRPVIRAWVQFVIGALLLLPWVLLLGAAGTSARDHVGTGWRVNHEQKQAVVNLALFVLGLPSVGLVAGLVVGVLRDRPGAPASWATGGFLLATAGLWIAAIVGLVVSLATSSGPGPVPF